MLPGEDVRQCRHHLLLAASHLFYCSPLVPTAGCSTWMYHLFSSDFCHDHS